MGQRFIFSYMMAQLLNPKELDSGNIVTHSGHFVNTPKNYWTPRRKFNHYYFMVALKMIVSRLYHCTELVS